MWPSLQPQYHRGTSRLAGPQTGAGVRGKAAGVKPLLEAKENLAPDLAPAQLAWCACAPRDAPLGRSPHASWPVLEHSEE